MSSPAKTKVVKDTLFLHSLFLLYSICGVLSKAASGFPFLSAGFITLYGAMLVLLAVYAILWQRILRSMPLTRAFSNKAVTIIWGMLWGAVLFGEIITANKLIGSLVIAIGVLVLMTEHE